MTESDWNELQQRLLQEPADKAIDLWIEHASALSEHGESALPLLQKLAPNAEMATVAAVSLIADAWRENGQIEAALSALKIGVAIDPKDQELQKCAKTTIEAAFANHAGNAHLLEATRLADSKVTLEAKLDRALVILQFVPNQACHHRSWGYGIIRELHALADRIVVDFEGKPSHELKISFAVDSLKILPKTHLAAMRMLDPDGLARLAWERPLAIVESVLQPGQPGPTPAWLEEQLVGNGTLTPADWKKWWATCRAELRKDPRFDAPTRKTQAISFQAAASSEADRLDSVYFNTASFGDKLKAIESFIRTVESNPNQVVGQHQKLSRVISDLAQRVAHHKKKDAALTFQALIFANQLLEMHQLTHATEQEAEVLNENQYLLDLEGDALADLIDGVNSSLRRRILQRLSILRPDLWLDQCLELVPLLGAQAFEAILETACSDAVPDHLATRLLSIIRQNEVSPETLLAIVRNYRPDHPLFGSISGTELFQASLRVLQAGTLHAGPAPRGQKRLYDAISGPALQGLIEGLSTSEAQEIVRLIQNSSALRPLDRQSLLGHIVRKFPTLKTDLTGTANRDKEAEPTFLYVSTVSYQRRKAELDDLVQRQIPENSKEIAVARSYGDLRENHEFKAAKEMQGVLMRRKTDLSLDLDRARVSDFEGAIGDVVAMGTLVELQAVDSPEDIRTYHILGAWDSDPSQGILSYKTEVGQAILGLSQGSIIELPLGQDGHGKFRIRKITPKSAKEANL